MYLTFLQATAPSSFLSFLPLILIFVIFYFLLMRPMQQQKKKHAEMLTTLKSGDVVVTQGGIVGTVTAIDGDSVILRIKPADVKLQFSRSAITGMVATESVTK